MTATGPLISIQYLRGLAALAVVAYHVGIQVRWPGLDLTWGKAGVDVFFVISGVVMVVAARARDGWDFLRRRLARVVPLYWVLTGYLVFNMVLTANPISREPEFWVYILKSLMFIPFEVGGSAARSGPLLMVGWTLNHEMLFYLLFALSFGLAMGRRILAISAIFAALTAAGLMWPELRQGPIGVFLTRPLALEFAAGMGIGWAVLRGVRLPAVLAGCCAVAGAGAIVLWPDEGPRDWMFMLPSVALVAGAVMLERAGQLPHLPGLKPLGDMSYALYLVHPFILPVLVMRLPGLIRVDSGWQWAGSVLVMTMASVVVSALVYRYVEQPLTRRFRP